MALYSHAGRLRSLLSRFGAAFAAEADALLDQVGMLDQAERTCGVLAYGDLKRVELAMALANQPRLLLMDEPTAGMAPKERVALMELAARLARARNIAVLFTEHDMDVVFSQADRIIVLDRGQLIAGGTPAGGARQSRTCARSISGAHAPLMLLRRLQLRRTCTPITAAPTSCTACRSRRRPARSWRCSAATAPASRR